MKRFSIVIGVLAQAAMLAAPAGAQYSHGGSKPPLHVNPAHDSCFFDLHPELTEGEFAEFADEIGSVARFRQLGDATTLGRGRFDLSVEYTSTSIDDTKGAWNNTMSHPDADHDLGEAIAFPRVVARYGVGDRVDVGAWGTVNPQANYGLVGIDSKIVLLRQGPGRPVSVSIRPSATALVGPSELWAGNASLDLSASRAFGPVSPYVGVATSASVAIETSDDVDLDPATGNDSLAYAGVAYRWRSFLLSAEVETGRLSGFGFRIGRQF
jgi:hypothetical protein